MGIIARTPIDVMLGEMAYGVTDETRFADLQAIASVISNRATALNVTLDQVVANQGQFNAYGKSLPAGANAYRDLAEAALKDVMENGPTHPGTFYATPSAVKGLPSGLKEVTEVVGGHRYFEDPYERAIKTSVGYRAPVDLPAARAAYAQRVSFETALVNGEDFATPQQRPDILNISQNPALLAGQPLSQVDPNISTGVPDISALTVMPEAALAQQLQASTAAPVASEQDLAAAASRFGEDPQAMISNPADLQAALSRMNTPAANPFDITQAMNDAIAQSVAASEPGFDQSRMADNAPLSEADKALQSMMKESVANAVTDRFAGPARPVTQTVQTTSVPGQVPSGSYVPGSMPVMDVSNVPANRVQSISLKPGETINSPEALSAALSNFANGVAAQRDFTAPAMTEAAAAKGDRIGGIDTSQMDTSRFGPDALQTADAALKDAISQATAPGATPTNGALQAAVDAAKRGPTPSVNAEANALQSAVDSAVRGPNAAVPSTDTALQAAVDAATRGPVPSNFSMTNNPAQAAIDSAVPSAMPAAAVASKTSRLPATDEAAAKDFAAEVQAGLPAERDEYDNLRAAAAKAPENYTEVNPEVMQDAMLAANHSMPVPTFNPTIAQPAVTPALPALDEVEIAAQPPVAAVEEVAPAQITPTVTKAPVSVTKSMPAVQQRQSTAMDVWGGKAQTGIATDGSTVSRISDNKVGRYVPEFDYTTFSTDEGATWSSPVAGNQLTGAKPALASIQPTVSRSLIDRLISALTGTPTAAVSPTDAGPPMGLDGGMSIGRDGPAGAPGGWGPGGSISNPGSAGGYGSTNGVDPNGTR